MNQEGSSLIPRLKFPLGTSHNLSTEGMIVVVVVVVVGGGIRVRSSPVPKLSVCIFVQTGMPSC